MKDKLHFHSIDALRFFAFLKVYLLHVPLQGSFPVFSFLKSGGGIGVLFFFVLSGFLITYLLVADKLKNGQVNLKTFFIRRSFRIWPLFYLMIILGFMLPYEWKEWIGFHMVGGGYDPEWQYSFSFLENYKSLFEDRPPKTTPLSVFWSLCIEEHFYLLWMVVFYLVPLKKVLTFLTASVLLSWLARAIEPALFDNARIIQNELLTHLDFFAIGGMLGYFTAKQYERTMAFIEGYNTWLKRGVVLSVVVFVICQDLILPNTGLLRIFRATIIALIFTVLIAVFLPPNSAIRIKSSVLAYLGKISYGLYVYHIICIHVVFQYFIRHHIVLDNWRNLSIYLLLTFFGSVALSALSFRYFEQPFLRLRNRLTIKKEELFSKAEALPPNT
jgi:peptidoglycan/LPS O-acetylase OafA/YrhL